MPDAARTSRQRRVLGLDAEQRQAQRRRLVLDAALELVGTQGYARTSIEALCQTAGVGTNSFYDLFASKEAVLVALYGELTAAMRTAVAEAYVDARHADDPIRPLVSAFVHSVLDDPRVARVAFVEAAGVSPLVEQHRRQVRNDFVDGLQAIGVDLREQALAASDQEAALPPPGSSFRPSPAVAPSPRRNAVALVGALIEMTTDWLHDPDPDPIDRLVDDVTYHCQRMVGAVIAEARWEQRSGPP